MHRAKQAKPHVTMWVGRTEEERWEKYNQADYADGTHQRSNDLRTSNGQTVWHVTCTLQK